MFKIYILSKLSIFPKWKKIHKLKLMPTEINKPKAETPSPYPQRIPWQSSRAAVEQRSRWTWRCWGDRTASGCAPPVGTSFSGLRKAYPYTSSPPPPFPSACTYRGTPRQSYPTFKNKKSKFLLPLNFITSTTISFRLVFTPVYLNNITFHLKKPQQLFFTYVLVCVVSITDHPIIYLM